LFFCYLKLLCRFDNTKVKAPIDSLMSGVKNN
jgi:hypothetical protein